MKAVTTRDPLRGMPPEIRAQYDRAPKALRQAYVQWWTDRPDRAAAHRDTWPAFYGGWQARAPSAKAA